MATEEGCRAPSADIDRREVEAQLRTPCAHESEIIGSPGRATPRKQTGKGATGEPFRPASHRRAALQVSQAVPPPLASKTPHATTGHDPDYHERLQNDNMPPDSRASRARQVHDGGIPASVATITAQGRRKKCPTQDAPICEASHMEMARRSRSFIEKKSSHIPSALRMPSVRRSLYVITSTICKSA